MKGARIVAEWVVRGPAYDEHNKDTHTHTHTHTELHTYTQDELAKSILRNRTMSWVW